ncbi:MAG TPA: hypothetical protein VE907_17650 [Gammaproteobacteria bacterium]|nr:hypothetical protein [Gammaproteobacteria bacterium]
MSKHFISKRLHATLIGGLAALLLSGSALAGPPLICHPFVTAVDAKLLPWVATTKDWRSPDPGYRVANLTADTLRLLTPDAPMLSRMENLRRATIYASQDSRVATELLHTLLARAESPASDPRTAGLAQFDFGYLVETYRQFDHAVGYGMVDGKVAGQLLPEFAKNAAPAEAAKVASLDAQALVRAAQQAVPALNAELEFAASLMSPDNKTAALHRGRAAAGASSGSLLAQNLAIYE